MTPTASSSMARSICPSQHLGGIFGSAGAPGRDRRRQEKVRLNIAAIRTLKQIEADGRKATAEEKDDARPVFRMGRRGPGLQNLPLHDEDWRQVNAEVRGVLTAEEYEAARASTPNAHYTSPMVIGAMWQALQRLGVPAGATVLEPSMGIGHFFGLQPPELLDGAQRVGVELDSVTAQIAMLGVLRDRVFARGFEATPLPNAYFDLAMGNVSFGNYPVHDPLRRARPHPRLLLCQIARQGSSRRDRRLHHQPIYDGQGRDRDAQISRRARGTRRRDPPAEHGLQGQCRHRCHDRHHLPAEEGARQPGVSADWTSLGR